MAYDLEEQEQIENLKSWWKTYGNLVTWILIIVLGAYACWNGWKYYQRKQAAEASQMYEVLSKSLIEKNHAQAISTAQGIQSKYANTVYAEMAGLLVARFVYDAGNATAAKTQLQWVMEKAKDEEYKLLAKVRLAGILLDEKSYDKGLELLSGSFPEAFTSLVEDRKGDFFAAQDKLDEARGSYRLAIEKSHPADPVRALIQIKLDAIGGAPTEKIAG